MQKRDDAFRSIGEVAALIGVPPHVLRYWETQFPQLKPMKRPDGRRYYRPEDVRLAAGLCELLRDDGLTIRGARKLIALDRGTAVRARGQVRLGEMATADAAPALPDADPNVTPDAAPPAQLDTPPPPPPEPPVAPPLEALPEWQDDASPPQPETALPPVPEDTEAPAETPPEDALTDTDPPEPPHQPHVRLRHRGRREVPEGQMALFDGPPPPASTWLPRLTRMAALLRAQQPGAPRWQQAAAAGMRLGNAISRLY
ncbi:MerR family transcriptional regulator [Paracoccus tibetensis]|uniref:MerR HTH family regulatory protein n=1 Tax=Paracoccus tibetensis TaxID=336292 RepID=A0A1G5GEF0_9RHOB|nr:MerR family transcriptional regulator [Paracoccus tibetensis]SCY49707.1 MerR HTH family regulatory protein [Paracoccus tibetensis]